MNLVHLMRRLVRHILPNAWLARHPSDAAARTRDLAAVARAHRVVREWKDATEMRRALEFESGWWERHGRANG